MSKLQLGFSPLTERIYLGRINSKKPNEWSGEKRDVTSDFIAVMLQKFEPKTIQAISINNVNKYRVLVLGMHEEIMVDGKRVDIVPEDTVILKPIIKEDKYLCPKCNRILKTEIRSTPFNTREIFWVCTGLKDPGDSSKPSDICDYTYKVIEYIEYDAD